MSKKKFTWDDLAAAIKKLPPKERKKQVCVSIDDETYFKNLKGLEKIPEDVYAHKENDEDCGTLEDLQEAHRGEEWRYKDYKLVTPKGSPFLWDGF